MAPTDLCRYEDDNLFAAALNLLERSYGQRRKLLDSLGEITLLEKETVPVFKNAADMNAELSYLIFLVRSSEVWGVSSRVSGPFGPDKYEAVVRTCDRLSEFLFHPRIKYDPPVAPPLGKAARRLSERLSAVPAAAGSQANPMLPNAAVLGSVGGEDEDEDGDGPVGFHQDILRSMNLQATLVEALNMDYNLSFKGSICSSDDKVKSREMLVHVQRKLVETLVNFVKGNEKNQHCIFAHLGMLRRHLGKLKLPELWPEDFGPAHQARLPVTPGLNAEEVIIECVRGNADLCQNQVPRDLLEEFGTLMDQEPDPSDCDQLELFQLMCLPDGPDGRSVPRNQEMVLEVLLSDRLAHLRACQEAVVFGPARSPGAAGAKPERIAWLLSACICQNNVKTAAKLQSRRMGIDATMSKIDDLAGKRGRPVPHRRSRS